MDGITVQIIVGTVTALIGGVLIIIVTRFVKRWDAATKAADKERKLHHLKTESIVAGLKRMNGNTSLMFEKVYDEELKSKLREAKFISEDE